MREVTAVAGQSVMDIAMQHCGDVGLWHEVAVVNGMEDTWVAEGGEVVLVPAGSKGVVKRLAREKVKPNTGTGRMVDGIGYELVGEMMIG